MYNPEILLEDLKIKRIAHMCGTHPTISEEMYDEIIELVEKQIKYRWHDLRKNPEDLPDEGKKVEAIYVYDDDRMELGYLYYKADWYNSGWNTPWNVIRWKEIEPF